MLKEILYHLPFGCLVYFHNEKDRFGELVENLELDGYKQEAENLARRYNRTANKVGLGMIVSLSPSFIYMIADQSLLSLLALTVNFSLSHNYGELFFGKVIKKWRREYKICSGEPALEKT